VVLLFNILLGIKYVLGLKITTFMGRRDSAVYIATGYRLD
jgi:hypothetical protein